MIRAIIVDDDKDTVLLFSELLQSNNIQVVGTGYNGQDAAFLYQKLKPDIVFLDVIMPVYDGVYGLKKIREINPDSVVVMTTDKMTISTQLALNKLQPSATLDLKNTLLELGVQEYDKVMSLLQKDYNSTLEDCYENPEFLKQILKDLFGDSYEDILSALNENMKEISTQKEIKDFLQVLST